MKKKERNFYAIVGIVMLVITILIVCLLISKRGDSQGGNEKSSIETELAENAKKETEAGQSELSGETERTRELEQDSETETELQQNKVIQEVKKELEELQKEIENEPVAVVQEGQTLVDPKETEVNLEEISGMVQKEDKTENSNFEGMTFPFQIPDSSMQIVSVGQYTGPFIETGQDIPTANVMVLVVKNTGDKMIEYGEINLTAGNDTAVFKVTALPAGTSAMVQELHQMEYSKDIQYSYQTAYEALFEEEKGLLADKVSITSEDGKLTVTNLTNETIPKLYVCYHALHSGGVYRGGITYRVTFENIGAGEQKTVESSHYYVNGSSILFVDIPPTETE